jgi:putative transposase
MKKGQFSQAQIIAIWQRAEKGERTIQALCKEQGLTQTTFYRWRKVYNGLSVSEASRLKALEQQNTRRKRLLAQRDLALDALQEDLPQK